MKNLSGISKWSIPLVAFSILVATLVSPRPTRAQSEIALGPRAFGLVRAIVVDIKDPDEAGRIKVQFPFLHGEIEAWARVSLPLGGNRTGLWALPETGDEVIIGFEQGDADRPIILGSLWNGRRPPTSEQ